jgi:hypothetical protein
MQTFAQEARRNQFNDTKDKNNDSQEKGIGPEKHEEADNQSDSKAKPTR